MTRLNEIILIIISNINRRGLNTPIKSKKLSDWRKKSKTKIYSYYKNHFKYKNRWFKREQKIISHDNTSKRKTGVAVLI